MFYEFRQNNSGGSFDCDENVCKHVFIEAADENWAVDKAESVGIYFDGVEAGVDWACCGDRWYTPTKMERPAIYVWFSTGGHGLVPLEEVTPDDLSFGHSGVVHYADGTKKHYCPNQNTESTATK